MASTVFWKSMFAPSPEKETRPFWPVTILLSVVSTMSAAPGAPVARGIRGGSAGSSSWITGGGKLFLTACRRATGRAFPPPSVIARSAATKRPRTTAPKLAMLPGLLRLRLAMTVGGKRGGAVRPSPNPGSDEQPHPVLRHLVGLRHHRAAGLD